MPHSHHDPLNNGSASGGNGELLSIGELSRATGLSIDTLRVWERRYGRPVPVRLPSGHRRYTPADARWLRRVAEALARGHRPREVLAAGEAELDLLLGRPERINNHFEPGRLLQLVRDWRRGELDAALLAAHARSGPRALLEEHVGPLLDAAGSAWADGSLDLRHEHFLSQTVDDLLRTLRGQLTLDAKAPLVVLATLDGELHALGLQMAALLCASHGVRPCLLGWCVPPAEIAAAAQETGARGVAISVSLAGGGVQTERSLAELRLMLPASVKLAVGGAGARGPRGHRRHARGIDYVATEGWGAFEGWLGELR
ncbi:MAG TPA: MerR family transcriptional regulator [Planctomycetota bacterium]|nr:MerR family transcriptional regulator [Planctomycetota bacterium]